MSAAISRIVEQVDAAEKLLAEGKTEGQVRQELGVSRRRTMRLAQVVRERWHRESDATRQQKRAEMRELLKRTYQAAMEREVPVTVGCGIGLSTVEHAKNPDIGGAIKTLELLCRFEGLLEQPETGGGMNLTVLQHIQQVLLGADGGAAEATVVDARAEDEP